MTHVFLDAFVYYTIEKNAEMSDISPNEEKEGEDSAPFGRNELQSSTSVDSKELEEMANRLSSKHRIDRDQLLVVLKEFFDSLLFDDRVHLLRKKREDIESDYAVS